MRAIICCGKYNARYISSKLRDHVNNAIKFSKIQYNRTRLYPESDNWCKIPVKYEILTISRYRGIYNAKYQQKWTRIFETHYSNALRYYSLVVESALASLVSR